MRLESNAEIRFVHNGQTVTKVDPRGLPVGWRMLLDDDAIAYFCSDLTGKTTYTDPRGLPDHNELRLVPDGQFEALDCYIDHKHKESSWHDPREGATQSSMQQWLRRDLADYLRRELARAPFVIADPPTELEPTSHQVVLPHDVCLASHHGDVESVQAFLASGGDVNAKATDDCGTLLIFAASAARDLAMVELLLRAGAKVNAQDRWGCTALASACCPLSFQPFRQQFLAEQPFCSSVDTGVKGGSIKKAPVIRDAKPKGSKSATPKSRQAVIELLIASSADPDLKDQAGLTPLMVATIASEHLVVRTLLSANIARDACDDNGMTALAHATSKGLEGIARLLRQPSSSLRKNNFFSSHSAFGGTAPNASPSAIAAADQAAEELLQADRWEASSRLGAGCKGASSGHERVSAVAKAKQKKAKRAAVAILSSPSLRRDAADEVSSPGLSSSSKPSAAASAAASAATFFNWAIGRDSNCASAASSVIASAASSVDTSAQASQTGSVNTSAHASRSNSRNPSIHGGNVFNSLAQAADMGGEDLVTRVTAALASLDHRGAAREEGELAGRGEAERDVGDVPSPGPLPPPALPEANVSPTISPARLRRKALGEAVSHALSQASMPVDSHHPQPGHVAVPVDFLCPITYELMREPVLVADGSTYEREAIEHWLKTHSTSPVTNERLVHSMIVPNNMARSLIRDFATAHPSLTECVEFWQAIERNKARVARVAQGLRV